MQSFVARTIQDLELCRRPFNISSDTVLVTALYVHAWACVRVVIYVRDLVCDGVC